MGLFTQCDSHHICGVVSENSHLAETEIFYLRN